MTEPIAGGTAIGAVGLTVADLGRSRAFYETVLGLRGRERADGGVGFGAPGGDPLVVLHPDASAPPLDPRATGLFHLAVLVPSRRDLGHALMRVVGAAWNLDGASDHLVSDALYLSDPDGNGIEIYRDRPRDEWPREPDGTLRMATLPLDLRDLAAEVAGAPDPSAPAATRIGHVHLQVSDLDAADAFYHRALGFDITVRAYPGALFVSAGGYHHHVGLNTWRSAGSGPPADGAIGLRRYEIVLPDADALAHTLERAAAAGVSPELDAALGGHLARDPSGNALLLVHG